MASRKEARVSRSHARGPAKQQRRRGTREKVKGRGRTTKEGHHRIRSRHRSRRRSRSCSRSRSRSRSPRRRHRSRSHRGRHRSSRHKSRYRSRSRSTQYQNAVWKLFSSTARHGVMVPVKTLAALAKALSWSATASLKVLTSNSGFLIIVLLIIYMSPMLAERLSTATMTVTTVAEDVLQWFSTLGLKTGRHAMSEFLFGPSVVQNTDKRASEYLQNEDSLLLTSNMCKDIIQTDQNSEFVERWVDICTCDLRTKNLPELLPRTRNTINKIWNARRLPSFQKKALLQAFRNVIVLAKNSATDRAVRLVLGAERADKIVFEMDRYINEIRDKIAEIDAK